MFLVSLRKGQATDVMVCNAIIKRLDTQLQLKYEIEDEEQLLLFRDINDNCIIKLTNSSYEVLVSWEDVSITWEPVSVMQCNDSIYLAQYACEHYLLDNPGWKQLRRYVKKTKKMNRLLKYAKSKQHHNAVKIKFGMKILRDHKEAMMFDANNGNTNWKESGLLTIKQIYNFDPFDYINPATSTLILPGHTKL